MKQLENMLHQNKRVNQERERHGTQEIEGSAQKRRETPVFSQTGVENSKSTLKHVRRFFYFHISTGMRM